MLVLAVSIPVTHPNTAATETSGRIFSPFSGSVYGYSRQWGSFGGPSGPNGIALDSSGMSLYVADAQNFAVGRMARNGTLEIIWGSYGAGLGRFRNPLGIATDSTGNVFVTD